MAIGYYITEFECGMEGSYNVRFNSDIYLAKEKCIREIALLNANYAQKMQEEYSARLADFEKAKANIVAEHNALVAAGLRKGECDDLRTLKCFYKVHKPFEPPSAIYAIAVCHIID